MSAERVGGHVDPLKAHTYRTQRRRRAALAAAAGALFSSPPALGAERTHDETVPSAVLFAGVSFGDTYRFSAGLSAQVSFVTAGRSNKYCNDEIQMGGGPQLQLVWFGDRDLVLTGGGQAGLAGDEPFGQGARVELGAAWHLFESRLGVHTGAHVFAGPGELGLRDEWRLGLHALGLGLALPVPENVYGGVVRTSTTCAVPGRPLRDAAGARVPTRAAQADAGDVAARWRADAQAECEAVASFLQVADALMDAGAPVGLVDAALAAAADEVRHALLCAARARDAGLGAAAARPVMPTDFARPTEDARQPGREAALIRLATESLADGLFNEGAAAARAAADPRRGLDARADRTLRRIAAEERRHARLGAAIAGWAADAGGDPVRDALSDLLRAG